MSRAGGSNSLVYHSGILRAQSRYYGIYGMQTGVEDTGQDPSCGCMSGTNTARSVNFDRN